PPVPVTALSTCSWIDHSVSGLYPATNRPIKTRFPYGSPKRLTLLQNISRRPIIQKVRGHPNKLRLPLLVRTRFQVLFHSPHRGSFRLSLTVLVHYRSVRSI